jgi:hypothetical protein
MTLNLRGRLFRVAAVVAAIQGAGHAALILVQRPTHGPEEVALVTAMQSQAFLFGGALRTYWGFYVGYAMMAALTCEFEALLFWRTASLAEIPAVTAVVASTFLVFNLAHAWLAMRYFFYLPVIFDIAVAALLAMAWVGSRAMSSPGTLRPSGTPMPTTNRPVERLRAPLGAKR